MADINGYTTATIQNTGFSFANSKGSHSCRLASQNYWYQMEGVGASSTVACSWVVQGSPDFTAVTPAAAAAILAASLSTPLTGVRVVATWPTTQ